MAIESAAPSMAPEPEQLPDASGHFGPYGGMFVAETLMGPLAELRDAYARFVHDPDFQAEFDADLAVIADPGRQADLERELRIRNARATSHGA